MASTFLNALSETPKIHTYPFVDSFFSKKRETAWLDDDTKSEEVSFFLWRRRLGCGGVRDFFREKPMMNTFPHPQSAKGLFFLCHFCGGLYV